MLTNIDCCCSFNTQSYTTYGSKYNVGICFSGGDINTSVKEFPSI